MPSSLGWRRTVISDSVGSEFEELVANEPSADAPRFFDTACVLGGSIAGLLAARVLADHARRVVVVERDDLSLAGTSRPGVPQDQQVHTLLPAGFQWIERWLPGFTAEATALGAAVAGSDRVLTTVDGLPQARGDVDQPFLVGSRPFLEGRIRAGITALPNVEILRSRATGLRYRDGAVSGVDHVDDGGQGTVAADFVVDAMGRSSRLSDWVARGGYDQPLLERVKMPINNATALFERPEEAADLATAAATDTPLDNGEV
jgi:2-polyprenyl-6-methoxyphenol hydroxylase-like FAD-dependent oxidoreductase